MEKADGRGERTPASAQAGSPGGPVVNVRGELVGVLAARESAQQTGYAATTEEIARFLAGIDATRVGKPF